VAAIEDVVKLDRVIVANSEKAVARGLPVRNANGWPKAECPPDRVRRFAGSLMKRPLSILFLLGPAKRSSRGLLEADLSYPALETHDNRHIAIYGEALPCDCRVISGGDAAMDNGPRRPLVGPALAGKAAFCSQQMSRMD
jgi:hypothetical protein